MSTYKAELDSLKEEMKEMNITHRSPTTSINYVKIVRSGKTPIYSLVIPNKLFLLWQKHRELQNQLGQQPSKLVALASHSVHGITLKLDASALEKRLQNESSRFQANYKKKGGPARKMFLVGITNILVMDDEILPPPTTTTTGALAESTASTSAADNVTVTTQPGVITIPTPTTSSSSTSAPVLVVMPSTPTTTMVSTNASIVSTSRSHAPLEISKGTTMVLRSAEVVSRSVATSYSTSTVFGYNTSAPMLASNRNSPISRSSPVYVASISAPVTYCSTAAMRSTVAPIYSNATIVSCGASTPIYASSITSVASLSAPLTTNTMIPTSISTSVPAVQGSSPVVMVLNLVGHAISTFYLSISSQDIKT